MKTYLIFFILSILLGLVYPHKSTAQACSNPTGVIYGLGFNGLIYPITVSNGSVGTAINAADGSPFYADAMGYDGLNGKFYFFNYSAPTNQFVSYDANLHIYATLTSCPSNSNVVAACVTPDGLGVYCRDDSAYLYFYDITKDKWKTISRTYYDQSGNNITSTIQGIGTGGDIAFDGNGNLWMLFSNYSSYGLYELKASVPTTPTAKLTLRQILPPTTATPDGTIIAGIAFSYTGQIYLSTLNNNLYILNNSLTTTLKGAFTTSGVGIDLTSCNYPPWVLAVKFIDFTAEQDNNQVNLNWIVQAETNVQYFQVQESRDGINWHDLNKITAYYNQNTQYYHSSESTLEQGSYFYRICVVDMDNKASYSKALSVQTIGISNIIFSPNPATNNLNIQSSDNKPLNIQVFDPIGRCVLSYAIVPGMNKVDISKLSKGSYFIYIKNENGIKASRFIKE